MTRACLVLVVAGFVVAQNRTAEWVTSGADAQRSQWIPNDPKISVEGLQTPGFQFLWKSKLGDGALTPAILMDRYIGYRGFRSFAFAASSSRTIYALDYDLNRIEWQKRLPEPVTATQSSCTGAVPALARSIALSYPAFGNVGRNAWARSDVGASGEGAVTLPAAWRAATAALAASPPTANPGPPRPPSGPRPSVIYVLADDMLYTLNVSNGDEVAPPIQFVPRASIAQGLTVVDNFAYAVTHECNGTRGAVWALDLATREVHHWNPEKLDLTGADVAFGPDGTTYATTTGGELVALASKTLALKDRYSASAEFTSSPVVFAYKGRNIVASATRDGNIHLIDGASPSSALAKGSGTGFANTLATWQSVDGIRWLLASSSDSVTAWKVVEKEGTIALERGWASQKMASPLTPMIVNGVVFMVAGDPAVLHALDGSTGKPLWDSGKTIAGVAGGSLSAGGSSQLYFSTNDGTIYAFGFPMEH
jgi:outer membrane protein assembly factor BamB